jgi:site-specific DNA-cytosine methylase
VFCGPVSSVYRQIGNAVPVKLAQALANLLLRGALRAPLSKA